MSSIKIKTKIREDSFEHLCASINVHFFALFKKKYFLSDYFCLENSELFNIWLAKEKRGGEEDALLKYVIEKSGDEDIQADVYHHLSEKCRVFRIHLAAKWTKCHRNLNWFQGKFSDWLNSKTIFQKNVNTTMPTSEVECSIDSNLHGTGRPELPYCQKSERSKRRHAADLSTSRGNETDLLVRAAAISARKQGQVDLAVVLKKQSKVHQDLQKLENYAHKR